MKHVMCLGLSPALQRTLLFDRLDVGEVNRARQVVESAAGKALNTARALATLGASVQTAGFNGGQTGRTVAALLKTYGVVSALTPMAAETRVCSTLIDEATGIVTELVEEAPAPGRVAVARFVRENLKHVNAASLLAISGTLPPFIADDFYVVFVQAAAQAGVPVVIDSHKAALVNVLFERPLLAKLNVRELAATLHEPMNTEKRILRGMRDMAGMGARNVFVTHGGQSAYLLTPLRAWRLTPPVVERHVNPIGSGDCTTAGIVHALLRGKRLPEAVRYGLACGSANVESLTPAHFETRRVRVLYRHVRCEPL